MCTGGWRPRLRSGARVAGLDSLYTSQQEGSEARREQIVGLGVYLLRIDNRVTNYKCNIILLHIKLLFVFLQLKMI